MALCAQSTLEMRWVVVLNRQLYAVSAFLIVAVFTPDFSVPISRTEFLSSLPRNSSQTVKREIISTSILVVLAARTNLSSNLGNGDTNQPNSAF